MSAASVTQVSQVAPAAPLPPTAPLRIAMLAPPWFELPPSGYGGIEAIVADLVDQMVERGHHVTLVGAGRNGTKAHRFVAVYPEPPSARLGTPVPEVVQAAAGAATLRRDKFDVVHDHTLAGPLLAVGRPTPTVVTMHGPVDGELGDYFASLGDAVSVVAISDAQRVARPDLNWVGTVHNAIDVASFPLSETKSDYVLWMGRFSPSKGAHLAIAAARDAGMRLIMAGKCQEPPEMEYFAHEVAPHLGRDVVYVGEADAVQKRELFANARALLFPITWEEPFGMVMIEAMACGTPVVALRRGSVPEVVLHGRTGFIVDRPSELPGALRTAAVIRPVDCRRHVEEQFDLSTAAAGYERIYRSVVDDARQRDRELRFAG